MFLTAKDILEQALILKNLAETSLLLAGYLNMKQFMIPVKWKRISRKIKRNLLKWKKVEKVFKKKKK